LGVEAQPPRGYTSDLFVPAQVVEFRYVTTDSPAPVIKTIILISDIVKGVTREEMWVLGTLSNKPVIVHDCTIEEDSLVRTQVSKAYPSVYFRVDDPLQLEVE
jgi:hypothetical protein